MANKKNEEIDIKPFSRFCLEAGKILDKSMKKERMSALSAAAMLEADFSLSKQTTYTRVLQLQKLHSLGKDPNITLKNLCAVLDAFDLELKVVVNPKGTNVAKRKAKREAEKKRKEKRKAVAKRLSSN